MNTGLDQNETELAVLVFSVALEMLTNCDGLKVDSVSAWLSARDEDKCGTRHWDAYLLDQKVEIFWNFGCEACCEITLSALWFLNGRFFFLQLPSREMCLQKMTDAEA